MEEIPTFLDYQFFCGEFHPDEQSGQGVKTIGNWFSGISKRAIVANVRQLVDEGILSTVADCISYFEKCKNIDESEFLYLLSIDSFIN